MFWVSEFWSSSMRLSDTSTLVVQPSSLLNRFKTTKESDINYESSYIEKFLAVFDDLPPFADNFYLIKAGVFGLPTHFFL